MPNLNSLLNVPLEKWPHKLISASCNSDGRISSCVTKINRVKYYVVRAYETNGRCYFKVTLA